MMMMFIFLEFLDDVSESDDDSLFSEFFLLYLDFLVRFEDFSGEEDSSSDDEEVF